jgi:hypothetical protein
MLLLRRRIGITAVAWRWQQQCHGGFELRLQQLWVTLRKRGQVLPHNRQRRGGAAPVRRLRRQFLQEAAALERKGCRWVVMQEIRVGRF